MTIYYDYFANGWLKAVRKGANAVASYSYDTSGNRTGVEFGNGTYETFEYDSDPRYRLASIDYAYGCDGDEDIKVRGTLDLTRDNAGNPLTWGNADPPSNLQPTTVNRLPTTPEETFFCSSDLNSQKTGNCTRCVFGVVVVL